MPFELGRPFGVPDDAAFQRRVLIAALELLEASEGPVLADFPEEAPEGATGDNREPTVWACPVSFAPDIEEATDKEKLRSVFRREVTELRPWYDLNLQRRGRTAMGNFDPESAFRLLDSFAFGEMPVVEMSDVSLALSIRLASHDLKAFYFEAVAARPGSALPESAAFNRWFWTETAAGRVLKAVKERCLTEEDEGLRMTGERLLIPLGQL